MPVETVPDLSALLGSWLIGMSAENKSPNTLKVRADSVTAYLRWCTSTGTPPTLTKPTVQAWVASMLAGGSSGTARTRCHAIKSFSKWLVDEGEIDRDDLAGLTLPTEQVKITDALTDAELRDLIKVCQGKSFADRRDEAIVRLMSETGMRAGECAALGVADMDVARGIAVIRKAKGGRQRIVPFGAQTAAALDRYIRMRRTHRLAATDDLWLGDRGKTFAYHALHRALGNRARLAGIDRFRPHLLRHTCATRWLAAGGSEGGLMAVAGWRKREMLDRYVAATAAERAADEARRLGLGEM